MAEIKIPRLILNFEDNIFLMAEGSSLFYLGDCCKELRIEKHGSNHAKIKMDIVGNPQIKGYLVSEEETAITKCDCGEVLGFGLKGCVVKCNYCGKELEL